MPDASKSASSKSEEILSVAQNLIQTKGYNGFSYRDVAAAIGIKSASVHYHFPTKGDLGEAATAQYSEQFAQALTSITQSASSARERLESYAGLFRGTLVEGDRLCMCGMLAGEVETVPEAVRAEVARFFEDQTLWLTEVVQAGIDSGEILPSEILPSVEAETWAIAFLSSLEGSMLVSRGFGNCKHFDIATQNMLNLLFQASP